MTSSSQPAPRVFVSHSRLDDDVTVRLVSDFEAAGAKVWVDYEDIEYGNFVTAISNGLDSSEWLVLVMTPVALTRPWVQEGVNTALHLVKIGRMKGVLFVLAQPCEEKTIPALWTTQQRYDATKDYPGALKKVLHVLRLAMPNPKASLPSFALPSDRFPPRLADLGFTAHNVNGVEFILPPLCKVPEGTFLMGSDPTQDAEALEDEQPQHKLWLPTYSIAKFPVTVAEYACCIRQGKRAPNEWAVQHGNLDHPVR